MAHRLAFVVLALLLTVGTIVVLWPERKGEVPAGTQPVDATEADAPDPVVDGAVTMWNDQDDAGSEPRREAVEADAVPQTPPPIEADGAILRVVDAVTGNPVPQAVVYLVRSGSLGDARPPVRFALMRPSHELLREHGVELRTDALGEVRMPHFAGAAVVGGKHDGKSGLAKLTPGADAYTLELHAMVALVVEVIAPGGQPCPNAPVALIVRTARGNPNWRRLWSASTGADGRAVLDDLRSQTYAVADDPAVEAAAVFDAAGLAAPRQDIDLRSPPGEPVVLVRPAVGGVAVTLTHPLTEVISGVEVSLEPSPGSRELSDGIRLPDGTTQKTAADGTTRFDHVAVGQRLRVAAVLAGSSDPVFRDFDGPPSDARTMFVELDMLGEHPVLLAELHDETGERLVDQRVQMQLEARSGESSSSSSSSVTSNGAGKLWIPVTDELRGADRTLHLTAADEATIRLTLPQPLAAGVNDLGVLTLRRPDLIAAGVVVGPDRVPVQGAAISLYRRDVFDANRVDGFHWSPADLTSATTDAAGTFALRGLTEPGDHSLSVSASGFVELEHQPVQLGATGLRLVLDRAGALTGRVLLDPFVETWAVVARVHDPARDHTETSHVDFQGRFALSSLRPGVVHLTVVVHAVGILHDRDGLHIDGGAVQDLGDIDLRGRLHRIGFRVVDPDDQPVPRAEALAIRLEPALGDGRRADYEGVIIADGIGSIVSTADQVDLFVHAPGHLATMFGTIHDQARLVLPRAPEVVVVVPPEAIAELRVGESLDVALRQIQGRFDPNSRFDVRAENRTSSTSGVLPWLNRMPIPVSADGRARVSIPAAGLYRVLLRLSSEAVQGRAVVLDGEGPEFTVTDAGVVPTALELPVSAASIERARSG